MQKGYDVFFKNGKCTILHKFPRKKLIAKVQMRRNKMLLLEIKPYLKEEGAQEQLTMDSQDERMVAIVTQTNFQTEVKDENWLSHLRFGHLNFKDLNLLHRKGMVRGLPLIEKLENLCEGCILSERHRESFPIGKLAREKTPLEP